MLQIKLAIDPVAGETLTHFPLLVALTHEKLKHVDHGGAVAHLDGRDLNFFAPDSQTPYPLELETYDPQQGTIRAWVRLPHLSASDKTLLCLRNNTTPSSEPVWDSTYRLVIHDPDNPSDATGNTAPAALNMTNAITVEAWVEPDEPRAETLQPIVSQWAHNEELDHFDAYDAGITDGLDTTGFFGAVFDGRYIYFSPQHDLKTRHGKALRYDTHGDFKNPDSWSAYDASNTDGLSTKGYYGAVFDGRYIIYPPRRDPDNFHSRVLRYDTHGDFKNPDSWSAYESRGASSSQSAAFDGQYIYFCPGQKAVPKTDSDTTSNDGSPSVTGMSADQLLVSSGDVMRYDTTGNFTDPSSWITHDISGTGNLDTRDYDGAVFDGRYIYFAPLSYGAVLRYDTQSDFQNKQSWTAFNAVPLGMRRCVGAVFDGQYIYFVPYGKSEHAIRYNTAGDFTDPTSWNAYHLPQTSALDTLGYDGAFFDGRYIYYVPYWDEKTRYHGVVLRYDTTGDFTHPTSWKAADAGLTDGLKTVGFNAGATDGRYLYFAAWMDGTGYPERIVGNGRVLRYDTTGNRAAFSLRFSDLGHNGGLCAALPGARFLVNTVNGPKSISANRPPQPGRQHLAGVYDGQTISLYINGQCVNQQSASGAIVPCTEDIAIGNILNGLGQFSGRISEIRISSCARSETWLRTQVQNQANPAEFCRIAT